MCLKDNTTVRYPIPFVAITILLQKSHSGLKNKTQPKNLDTLFQTNLVKILASGYHNWQCHSTVQIRLLFLHFFRLCRWLHISIFSLPSFFFFFSYCNLVTCVSPPWGSRSFRVQGTPFAWGSSYYHPQVLYPQVELLNNYTWRWTQTPTWFLLSDWHSALCIISHTDPCNNSNALLGQDCVQTAARLP